jgi:hypothetical protein
VGAQHLIDGRDLRLTRIRSNEIAKATRRKIGMTHLFEAHLRQTSSLTGSDQPFLEEDSAALAEALEEVLCTLADGIDDDSDLETQVEQLAEYFSLD